MKVKELKQLISTLPDDHDIICEDDNYKIFFIDRAESTTWTDGSKNYSRLRIVKDN